MIQIAITLHLHILIYVELLISPKKKPVIQIIKKLKDKGIQKKF